MLRNSRIRLIPEEADICPCITKKGEVNNYDKT